MGFSGYRSISFRYLNKRARAGGAVLSLWLALGVLFASPAAAQHCTDSSVPGTLIGFAPSPGVIEKPNSCNLLPCYKPEEDGGAYLSVDENCDALSGSCPVQMRVPLKFPGNSQLPNNAHVRVYWFDQATPDEAACLPPPLGSCSPISICGSLGAEILVDRGETWIQVGASCESIASGEYAGGSFSLSAYACQTFSGECTERLDVPGLELPSPEEAWDLLECDPPPPPCNQCPCNIGGGGCGGNATGGSAFCLLDGPGAFLRYQAKGAGHPDFPGTADWNTSLGRYWSHDYAERIVMDPDEDHVWLITREAGFHEFSGLVGGIYQDVTPSDEYRQLSRTAGGWVLRDLDGMVQSFDTSGLWVSTVDRYGNATVGTYIDGKLSSVNFPDQRSETFTYGSDGKLAEITEVGVDGVTSRTWRYTWSGLDLVRIDRPDGTARAFRYDDPRHPGYMTRITLVGTDGGERVESAREYDERGNVVRVWKGDVSFTGPGAVDNYSFKFDNAFRPKLAQVTGPLGNVTTYEVGRDPGGVKPRIAKISGDCSTCSLSSSTQRFYEDPQNPLRVTRSVDARGTVTLFEYDGEGQMISRTEAFMTELERTTSWEYDSTYPRLVAAIEQPSTSGSGVHRTSWTYDAIGNAITRTEEGVENGSVFSNETVTAYNSAGLPELIDPPGYATQDQRRLSYDPSRGNLIVKTRTDPLIGITSFSYDAFNRRMSVTDVNGVVEEMTYDSLDRAETLTQRGAIVTEDLITTHVYNEFGDLFRTFLPKGNIIERSYDVAGRLISVERKADVSTPGERTFFTLDGIGHQIRVKLQEWKGGVWVTKSSTGFEYSTGCQLDKVMHPDGTVTEYSYDCNGNLEQVWDANHPSDDQTRPPTHLYSYNALDRLETIIRPWAGPGGGTAVMTYGYDVQDNLTRVVDANATVTSYVYSDRKLMTREDSEISGITDLTYNEHGELVGIHEGRGVSVTWLVDALDRPLFADHPGSVLDTTYGYDDPAVPFSKGKLTSITRGGQTVNFRYNRFGWLTQDGVLNFTFDRNGNPVILEYPGGLSVSYGYDFADRQVSLSLQGAGEASGMLVSSASYLPFGPLADVNLGNGLTEIREFDKRYFPTRIQVSGLLDWEYATDAMGHVTTITDHLDPADSRSYGYLDFHYFLNQGVGPWGSLTWSYDKVGNRLSETRNGTTYDYSYEFNSAGGRLSTLQEVTSVGGQAIRYSYDGAGNQTLRLRDEDKVRTRYDAEGRLAQIRSDASNGRGGVSTLSYDGRKLLKEATLTSISGREMDVRTTMTYSSMGLFHSRSTTEYPGPTAPRGTPLRESEAYVIYFGVRPLAIFNKRRETAVGGVVSETESLTYLTTDHIRTTVLTTDSGGNVVWSGGLEPFGIDDSGALDTGLFLRFPGQWVDRAWSPAGAPRYYYNVYRWYAPDLGRYTVIEPLIHLRPELNYSYAFNSPVNKFDPDGLTPKPSNGKWCSGITKPRSCDCRLPRINQRLADALSLRDRSCSGRADPDVGSRGPRGRVIQLGGIDWSTGRGRAWYLPQGDRCVDYCLCEHEGVHIDQSNDGRMGRLPVPALQCQAFEEEISCLARFATEILRGLVPGL